MRSCGWECSDRARGERARVACAPLAAKRDRPATHHFATLSYNGRIAPRVTENEDRMHFQFNVASAATAATAGSDWPPPTHHLGELLRGILEAQHEQIRLLRHQVAAHDAGGKWRSFLERWKEDFG